MKILIVPVSCLTSTSTGSGVDGDGHRLMIRLFDQINDWGFFGGSLDMDPLPIPILYPDDWIAEAHALAFRNRVLRRTNMPDLVILNKDPRLGLIRGDALANLERDLSFIYSSSGLLLVMVPVVPDLLASVGRALGLSQPVPSEIEMGWLGHVDPAEGVSQWFDPRPPPIVFHRPPPIQWEETDDSMAGPVEDVISEPEQPEPGSSPGVTTGVAAELVSEVDIC